VPSVTEIRLSSEPPKVEGNTTFPYQLPVVARTLDLVEPEPPRDGQTPDDCDTCSRADEDFFWTDASWRLHSWTISPIPGVVLLSTRAHYDSFMDLPPDLLAEVGPMTARVERAIYTLGNVGRVHVNRWGDGSAHFHLWFYPRPLGQLQLRGSFITAWCTVLERQTPAEIEAVGRAIAAAMDDQ
jgi:diadenosine tetraphosphate (Ap4A) HIT family hydrolase